MEGRLNELAKTAGRAVLASTQSSSSKLPESDRGEMEVFLEKVDQLLPVLGIDLLVPMAGATTSDAPTSKRLYCEIKRLKAMGFRTANGFLVQKDSEAVLAERPSSEKWPWTRNLRQKRQKLKDDGVLVENGGRFLFTKDIEFASPSAAAAVIQGGHANGLTAWKDANGKTLRALTKPTTMTI